MEAGRSSSEAPGRRETAQARRATPVSLPVGGAPTPVGEQGTIGDETLRAEDSIPLSRPFIGAEEERAVCEVLRSGWLSHGPSVIRFEERLAEYLRCRFVRAVNSGSSALHLALKALDIGPGDSVVVPALSCVATALPVLAVGANVVFADIDLITLNLSWSAVERVLRPNTKAVVLVHAFGRMADAIGFAAQCDKRGLHLVEDACLALGATQETRQAGTIGRAGCFSFYPGKVITTGEGGAVATDDEFLAASIEQDRNYGAASSAWNRIRSAEIALRGFERPAFNFKMSDVQAAIGIVQLDRLPNLLVSRHRIASRYAEALAGLKGIALPGACDHNASHIHQSFVCLWQPVPVSRLLEDSGALDDAVSGLHRLRGNLRARGVMIAGAGQFLPALPVFRPADEDTGALRERFPYARLAEKLAFRLPIFPGMQSNEIDRVVHALRVEIDAACIS